MAERTIGDQQAEFEQWSQEWLAWPGEQWVDKTPGSLLDYFKTRLCITTEPL